MTDSPITREYPLQPLRIPGGWTVTYNFGLYEVDPAADSVPEADRRLLFKQDMLQMRHERNNRLLDLGWYPEDGDMESGRYGLVVCEGDFHGTQLHEFRSRDRAALVAEIERLLVMISRGEM